MIQTTVGSATHPWAGSPGMYNKVDWADHAEQPNPISSAPPWSLLHFYLSVPACAPALSSQDDGL